MSNREELDDAMGITTDAMLNIDDLDEDNVDEYLSDVRSAIKHTADNPHDEEDQKEIERYNNRKNEIAQFRKKLDVVGEMENKDWAQQILKNSAHNMLVAQKVALDEIAEDPMSKKITSMAEISNAITSAAKTMMDIDTQDENLQLSKEKNRLRKLEVESKLNILDTSSLKNNVGSGSTEDMLELLETEDDEKVEDV
jgi:hypothetical protein